MQKPGIGLDYSQIRNSQHVSTTAGKRATCFAVAMPLPASTLEACTGWLWQFRLAACKLESGSLFRSGCSSAIAKDPDTVGKAAFLEGAHPTRHHFSSQMSPSLQCIVICASRRTLPRRMWPSTSCMTASSFTRSRGVSASGMFHWRCQTMLFLMTSPTQRLSSMRYQAPWNCSQNPSEGCEHDADGRLVTSPQFAHSSRQGRS